jgi:uncharacterized OsmC-like protein
MAAQSEPSNKNCVNGIDLQVLGQTVEAVKNDPELGKCKFRVKNKWVDANHNCTTVKGFYAAKAEHQHKQNYELHADEPPMLAGNDDGPNPVEHLLNALVACVTTGMVAHGAVRGIKIEALESELEGDLDLNGFLGLSNSVPRGYQNIRMKFKVKTDKKNLEKIKALAEYSPVYNSLVHGVKIDIDVEAM